MKLIFIDVKSICFFLDRFIKKKTKMKNIMYHVFQKCCGCEESLRNKNHNRNIRRVTSDNLENTRIFFGKVTINISDYKCNRCRKKVIKNDKKINSKSLISNSSSEIMHVSETNKINDSNIVNDNHLIMLATAFSSHKKCLICKNIK